MGASAALSVGLHVLLVAAMVGSSEVASRSALEEYAQRVAYLPPPNREPSSGGVRESIRYVELTQPVLDVQVPPVDPVDPGAGAPVARSLASAAAGPTAEQTTDASTLGEVVAADSVFTIVDVDTAATRLPGSAVPQYPPLLLELKVEGMAVVQFIVDTLGAADPASFFVISSTHPEFAESIRQALPGMRFSSARIGAMKVRQVVELPLRFTIARPPDAPDSSARLTSP